MAAIHWKLIVSTLYVVDAVLNVRNYDYLPTGVPFCRIPESLRQLTQPVVLVDDRRYSPGRHELAQDGHILLVHFRNEKDHLLAHEPDLMLGTIRPRALTGEEWRKVFSSHGSLRPA